jgi:hypothetical protein
MISFVLRNFVIEHCYARGCPLEDKSEHCFLSIKDLLFWCYDFIYCVVLLLFYAIFLFSAIIIDLVPYKWYQSTFLGRKCGFFFFFFEGRDVFWHLKTIEICCLTHKSMLGEAYMHELQVVLKHTLLATFVTLVGTPSSHSTSYHTCIRIDLDLLKPSIDKPINHLTTIVPLRTTLENILSSTWVIR